MQRLKIMLIIITIPLVIGACSPLGGSRLRMLNMQDEGKIARGRLEQILEAIENKDKEIISDMFSQQAHNEIKDFDAEVEGLFNALDGDVESGERIGGNISEKINHGQKTTKSFYSFYINTEKEKYVCIITECLVDTEHPENKGVYIVAIVNEQDTESTFSDAGIYVPEP